MVKKLKVIFKHILNAHDKILFTTYEIPVKIIYGVLLFIHLGLSQNEEWSVLVYQMQFTYRNRLESKY